MYACSHLLKYFSSASCRTLQEPSRENNYCLLSLFRFGRTRVCMMPISLHQAKKIGSFRFFGKKNCSEQSCRQSYHTLGLGYLLRGIDYYIFALSLLLATTTLQSIIVVVSTSLGPLGYHGTFFYICLANHSAVSKPHPTAGDEIYAGCGIPGYCLWSVLCGVHAALWWSLCSLPVLFAVLLWPWLCFSQRARYVFEK